MFSYIILSTLALSLLSNITYAFDTNSKENVVLYWGQNSAGTQERLSYYCEDDSADILVLSFMSAFPGTNNVPTLNFANACETAYSNGLLHCSTIAEDIKTCQSKGKIVLLSMGGASGAYGFSSASQAEDFSSTLWDMFGEGSYDNRPFDDAVIDGFDLDIEDNIPAYYSDLVSGLRTQFAKGSKQYYISSAPQCPLPDASLNQALISSDIDFAFIQFYNNYCSLGSNFNYDTWSSWANSDAYNKNIKLYMGLPGASSAAGSGYVSPDTVKEYVEKIACDEHFGGISIWDASQAYSNNVNGENFAQAAKSILESANTCGSSDSTTFTSTTSTSTTSTSKSTSSISTYTSSTSDTTRTTLATYTSASESSTATSDSSSVTQIGSKTVTIIQPTSSITTTIDDSNRSSKSQDGYSVTSTKTIAGTTDYITIISTVYTTVEVDITLTSYYYPDATLTSSIYVNEPTMTSYTDATNTFSTKTDSESLPSNASSTSSPCNNGDWQCGFDGSLQRCNFGKWISFQCSAGTTCKSSGSGLASCDFA